MKGTKSSEVFRNSRRGNLSETSGLKPYFEAEGFVLYQGDSLGVLPGLPDGCAHALITDPPYSSGGRSTFERAADPRKKYCQGNDDQGRPSFRGDNRDQRSFRFWAAMWLMQCRRLVADGGYCLVFTDWRQLPTMTDALQAGGFTWRGVVPWNKGRGSRAPHKGYFRHQCEYVAWGTNGECPKAVHGGPFEGCIDEPVRQVDKFHMTGKPTRLMRELIACVPESATATGAQRGRTRRDGPGITAGQSGRRTG